MENLSNGDFAPFVGKIDTGADLATSGLMERFSAVFGKHLAHNATGIAAPGFHWCLTVPAVAERLLGQDGHIADGGFLPYINGVRRMWGGGAIEVKGEIRVGSWVSRQSRITSIQEKNAKSGRLLIMHVDHAYAADDDVVIVERQDIVYRYPTNSPSEQPTETPQVDVSIPDSTWTIDATSILLFRYSAVTFNSHRIHYDEAYARDVEGYAGLVVHGPIQATLLLNLATEVGGRVPRNFSYRAVAPLFAGSTFDVCANLKTDGTVSCWTRSASGRPSMLAEASW